MIKDHSYSERKPLLGLFVCDYQQGFFYMHHPTQDSTYHSLCYTSCETLAGCRRKEILYLTMHSTYGNSNMETHCQYMGYSFWLAARVVLYTPSHTQDRTYHGICYISLGGLAGTRNSYNCVDRATQLTTVWTGLHSSQLCGQGYTAHNCVDRATQLTTWQLCGQGYTAHNCVDRATQLTTVWTGLHSSQLCG